MYYNFYYYHHMLNNSTAADSSTYTQTYKTHTHTHTHTHSSGLVSSFYNLHAKQCKVCMCNNWPASAVSALLQPLNWICQITFRPQHYIP